MYLYSIPMNMDEPIGLRSTLLLAGLHFKLATGGAQLFDETFWFHKGEAIRCVTKGISDPNVRTRPPFMKLVATLSMLEVCVLAGFLFISIIKAKLGYRAPSGTLPLLMLTSTVS